MSDNVVNNIQSVSPPSFALNNNRIHLEEENRRVAEIIEEEVLRASEIIEEESQSTAEQIKEESRRVSAEIHENRSAYSSENFLKENLLASEIIQEKNRPSYTSETTEEENRRAVEIAEEEILQTSKIIKDKITSGSVVLQKNQTIAEAAARTEYEKRLNSSELSENSSQYMIPPDLDTAIDILA